MRALLLLACVSALHTSCAQKSGSHDYATLPLKASDSQTVESVATPLISHVTVNKNELSVRADFDSKVLALMPRACGKTKQSTGSALAFIFNDDTMSNPVRSAEYVIDVQRNCSSATTSGRVVQEDIVLGMRTTSSPLWRIWTFASFARHEIRLGRAHPKNQRSRQLAARRTGDASSVRCAADSAERLCRVSNVSVHGLHHGYTLDFHSRNEKVYVPRRVFLHYTSVAGSHCLENSALLRSRDIGDWPALTVEAHGTTVLHLRSRLFVPLKFEAEFSAPDASEGDRAFCDYAAMLIRTAGVLVVHDDTSGSGEDSDVVIGNAVLRDYTLGRDYLGGSMTLRSMELNDHFTYWETLAVLYVFTLYIAFKSDSMVRLASYALGVPPMCSLCKEPMVRQCARHGTVKLYIAHKLAVLSVFVLAWYAVIVSSKLGVGYNETELVVWSFAVLGAATLEYFVCTMRLLYYTLPDHEGKTIEAREQMTVQSEQMYELMHATAIESACTVALFALTSVVRSDDLGSTLSMQIALVVIYDGFRRFFTESVMILVRAAYANSRRGASWLAVFWTFRALVVGAGLNTAFTTYVMVSHVLMVALDSKTFTAIFVFFCVYIALSITAVHLFHAMVTHVLAARTQK